MVKPSEPKTKTSLRVDRTTWTRLRVLSVEEHRPIAELLKDMLATYTKMKKAGGPTA
jgi:hypothetical protein